MNAAATILLVEDDPGIGRAVSRGLVLEGHRVEWRRDGIDVAGDITRVRPDAIVLDLGLPYVCGLTLCRTLRAAGDTTPVLMLTARGTLQDRLDGFGAGADDYLPKPFSFAELSMRLAALLRRSKARAPQRISSGALALDAQARIARIGTHAIPLSPREFTLLATLAAAANATIARATLIEAVWHEHPDISDNLLDVYVGYVRRKLTAADGAPRIETVRGQGYRLVT